MSWARLLKRVFNVDIEHCPNCGGALKMIAAIEDPPVIAKILTHLGLPSRAPGLANERRGRFKRVPLFLSNSVINGEKNYFFTKGFGPMSGDAMMCASPMNDKNPFELNHAVNYRVEQPHA